MFTMAETQTADAREVDPVRWSLRGHAEFKGSRGHCPLCLAEVCVWLAGSRTGQLSLPRYGHQLVQQQLAPPPPAVHPPV